ncbi:23933_t:CDS:2 [Gigaspora rosea]|nr:23933_t:CDS:2 [Gigaspora rosea]
MLESGKSLLEYKYNDRNRLVYDRGKLIALYDENIIMPCDKDHCHRNKIGDKVLYDMMDKYRGDNEDRKCKVANNDQKPNNGDLSGRYKLGNYYKKRIGIGVEMD